MSLSDNEADIVNEAADIEADKLSLNTADKLLLNKSEADKLALNAADNEADNEADKA